MALFNNNAKGAVVFIGLVCALYGFTAVRSRTSRFSGGGTVGGGSLMKPRASYVTLPGQAGGTYEYQRGQEQYGREYDS